MEIRPARPADARTVVPLIIQASKDVAHILTGTQERCKVIAQLAHFFHQPNNRLSYQNTLIADVDGQAAGMIISYFGADAPRLDQPITAYLHQLGLETVLEKEADNDEWYIDLLAVSSYYSGRGIGSALIYAVEQRAQHLGQSKVALLVDEENTRAHRLYLHLGFKPERSINLYQHPHLHMIKNL